MLLIYFLADFPENASFAMFLHLQYFCQYSFSLLSAHVSFLLSLSLFRLTKCKRAIQVLFDFSPADPYSRSCEDLQNNFDFKRHFIILDTRQKTTRQKDKKLKVRKTKRQKIKTKRLKQCFCLSTFKKV